MRLILQKLRKYVKIATGDVMEALYQLYGNEILYPTNEHFHLHVHDNYEIYMFFEGDTKYVVEENVYSLEPFDVIIIRKNQMHRVYHNSNKKYSRVVLNISPDFFKVNNCPEYEKLFIDEKSNIGNKIDAKTVKKSGLYDAFARLRQYSKNFTETKGTIITAIIIEILHIICNIDSFSEADITSKQLKEIISYISDNITENITLDMLEKKFFISKYHLCHIFPKATGITVHQFITKKRLMLVKDLVKNGKSLSQSATTAGFKNYSCFYKAHIKEFGVAPNENIK